MIYKPIKNFYDAYLETRRATEESYDEDVDEDEDIDESTNADDSIPMDTYSVTKDPTTLLKQLKELKDEGIISEDEYRSKARKIFDNI